MKKLQVFKKVAVLGQKAAVKANGDASLYLLFQPKEPELFKKNSISKGEMTKRLIKRKQFRGPFC